MPNRDDIFNQNDKKDIDNNTQDIKDIDAYVLNLQDDKKLKNKISNIFRELEEEFTDEFDLNLEKSKVFADIEKYHEAIIYLDSALKINNDKKILFLKAEYLHELKEDEKSLKIVNEILDSDPDCYEGLKLKVSLLCSLKKYDEADIIFNKATSINPEDSEIWQLYADEFDSISNYDKALKINTTALELFPDNLDLLYDRRYYLLNNNADESLINEVNNQIQNRESNLPDDYGLSSTIIMSEIDEEENKEEIPITEVEDGENKSLDSFIVSGPKHYEDDDNKSSDDNDIFDIDSEDKHFDDEDNVEDLDYDFEAEEEINEDIDDSDSSEEIESDDEDNQKSKTKEVTLDNFFNL